MKTAREKAEYWLNNNVAGWDEAQLKCLATLLKEQDRDTRHACAEAVNRMALDNNVISQAHNTVMRTKAL